MRFVVSYLVYLLVVAALSVVFFRWVMLNDKELYAATNIRRFVKVSLIPFIGVFVAVVLILFTEWYPYLSKRKKFLGKESTFL